uniref:tetratricopeptide repeat protein n=1 Tax=Marinobacterium profundum TaxID=1714300 RepID=UPI00082DD4FA|nr:tetratricopeptide repeat protein [Marinobacterium profundum]
MHLVPPARLTRGTARTLALGTLLVAILAGCSGGPAPQNVARPDSPYCLRGGDTESFSCDPSVQASVEPAPTTPRSSGNLTDDALYADLAEIKNWLNNEKDARADSIASSDESDVILPPPVAPQAAPEPKPAPPLPTLLANANYRNSLEEAQSLYRQGFYQHAQEQLSQLIPLYPQRPEAYNNLGVMLAETGQYSEAISQLQRALSTHPYYATIHANLRSLYGALAGNTYSDALGLRRNRPALRLDILEPGQDTDSTLSITAEVEGTLESWAKSPSYPAQQRAALYIPGFRPNSKTDHAQWLKSLDTPAPALQLQAYELALMTSDWVEVTLQAGPLPSQEGNPVQRVLSLIRMDSSWRISAEQPLQ